MQDGTVQQRGRGQPHSKEMVRVLERKMFRQVLECGCPLPLSSSHERNG
jgi:hypothetical protein